MKIRLQGGTSAPEEIILAFESKLGCRLSHSVRAFLRTHDGAKPETNIFRITSTNGSGVNQFIPIAKISQERRCIENLSGRVYPIAWAEGGNYVLVDEDRDVAVFFWDHELPDCPIKLASNFAAFLELLEPLDINKVQLKPGQVKKVWIDPEFLKKLKKQ